MMNDDDNNDEIDETEGSIFGALQQRFQEHDASIKRTGGEQYREHTFCLNCHPLFHWRIRSHP